MGYGLAAKAIAALAVVLVLVFAIGAAKLAYSRAETAELAAKTEAAARIAAEANLATVEANARLSMDIAAKAAEDERTLRDSIAKLRRDLANEKRKPVPAACVAACDDHFEPVRDVLNGLRAEESAAARSGDASPP